MVSALLFFTGILIAVFTRLNRSLSVLVAGIFLLYLVCSTVYFGLNQLTGHGLNESVVFYLWADRAESGLRDFLPLIIKVIFILTVSALATSLLFKFLQSGTIKRRLPASVTVLTMPLLLVGIYLHPLTTDFRELHGERGGQRFVDHYRIPVLENINDKKNLVYIYLEGLERTYLDQSLFPGLTPELQRLEEKALTFVNIDQPWGTGWTIGGMTASQCGIPLVTSGSGGSTMYGLNEFLPNAVCIGDLLKQQGYTLSYLGGAHSGFAGKGKFYSSHGFSRISGREELKSRLQKPDYLSSWGLFDDTLLELAWEEFNALSSASTPFGLYLLTLDTHHPDGYPSASCKSLPQLQKGNSMLDAVACTDYLVGKFVRRIQDSEHANDTLIVIASDHLAFPNKASKTLERGIRRSLFMAIAPGEILPRVVDRAGSPLDMAPTVLNLLGFEAAGLGLGKSLTAGHVTLAEQFENLDGLLKSFESDIRSLWEFPELKEEVRLLVDQQVIDFGEQELALPVLLKIEDAIDELGKTEFEIENIYFNDYWYVSLKDNLETFGPDDKLIWLDQCENIELILLQETEAEPGNYCAFGGRLGRSAYGFREINSDGMLDVTDLMEYEEVPFDERIFSLQKRALREAKGLGQHLLSSDTLSIASAIDIVRQENTPEAYLNLSLGFYNLGRFQESIEAAESSLALRPNYSLAFNNICTARIELQQYDLAIRACEQALELDPDFDLARNNLQWANDEKKATMIR